MLFSNREIAVGIWLSIFIAFIISKTALRKCALSMVKSFFNPKLFSIFLLSYFYIYISVYFLFELGIWTIDNIKTTVIWSVCNTFIYLMTVHKKFQRKHFLKNSVREIVTISGIVIFVVELQSLNLIVEIILVPLTTILATSKAIADHKYPGEKITKIINITISVFSLAYIGCSVYLSVINFSEVATYSTVREFLIPIILVISFLPFLYLLAVIFTYETAFILLNRSIPNKPLRRIAKLKSIFFFGLNAKDVKLWSQATMRFKPKNKKELEELFSDARLSAKRRANPPSVKKKDGWSPYAAKNFLENEGITTRDYIRIFNNEWSSSSDYYNIEDEVLSNTICYYVCGNDLAATELLVVLDVRNPKLHSPAESKYINICKALLLKSTDSTTYESTAQEIEKLKDFRHETPFETISQAKEYWEGGIEGGYSIKLTIQSKSHQNID